MNSKYPYCNCKDSQKKGRLYGYDMVTLKARKHKNMVFDFSTYPFIGVMIGYVSHNKMCIYFGMLFVCIYNVIYYFQNLKSYSKLCENENVICFNKDDTINQ